MKYDNKKNMHDGIKIPLKHFSLKLEFKVFKQEYWMFGGQKREWDAKTDW